MKHSISSSDLTEPAETSPPNEGTGNTPPSFGVYIHIPFCAAKCDYCAFATWTDRHHLISDYLEALQAEIARAVADGMPAATSIFVGGGTPTLVPADGLAAVIAAIPTTTVTDADASVCEITVECNPDDVTTGLLQTYRDAGVNRVSIGVQSTAPHVLAELGRSHRGENIVGAVEAVRAVGLESFNLDLIYGARGETDADWGNTLDDITALGPPHVSAYGLTPEPGTPLGADRGRHPDSDVQATRYEIADERLAAVGLQNYEISNWARPGHQCRHNRLYWEQGDYLGFGCAAHSHRGGRRWWNVRTPQRYIDTVRRGESPQAAGEDLDAAARAQERLELALRTSTGVPAAAFDGDDLRALIDDAALLQPAPGDRVVLTRRGRLLANEVSLRLRSHPRGGEPGGDFGRAVGEHSGGDSLTNR